MTSNYAKKITRPWLKISVNGKKRFAGYPGLTLTALQISEYIPPCKIFIEPFAGLGRISRHVKAERFVLNDKSEYALIYLKNHFTSAEITNLDFVECMKRYDDKDAFFFIDPPWHYDVYDKNSKCYCDRLPIEYYLKIFSLLKEIKGDWILCSDYREAKIRNMLSESGYPMRVIVSRKKFIGNYARTRIISNKPFVRYNQHTLF